MIKSISDDFYFFTDLITKILIIERSFRNEFFLSRIMNLLFMIGVMTPFLDQIVKLFGPIRMRYF
jgi:hypothetical protein